MYCWVPVQIALGRAELRQAERVWRVHLRLSQRGARVGGDLSCCCWRAFLRLSPWPQQTLLLLLLAPHATRGRRDASNAGPQEGAPPATAGQAGSAGGQQQHGRQRLGGRCRRRRRRRQQQLALATVEHAGSRGPWTTVVAAAAAERPSRWQPDGGLGAAGMRIKVGCKPHQE